ncbi:hypothetical protein KFE25_002928 [Diacronema lutheri]|uniref:Cyclin N-terminal domain-containing protein n=1 Tax=Diacronema lutheri TaxID=2081491 RepID=A0A8J6CC14_DIALT|nr:hypothetical protein KFE25_002928 [Diacronema lutheri]
MSVASPPAPALPVRPERRTLDENLHPPPITLADVDENLVIRGFAHALTRHLHAFHVLTVGSGVWSTEPPPCETPLFSERAVRFHLGGDENTWAASDRTQPPADIARQIEHFLRSIYTGVDLEPPVVVYALVLIERFARCAGEIRGTVRMHTLRPLVITALIIACKLYFDEDVYVGDFTRLALGDDDRTVEPLVRCEVGFLQHISYVMIVRPRTFAQYLYALKNLVREEQHATDAAAPPPPPRVSPPHLEHVQQQTQQLRLQHGATGGNDEPMPPADRPP